MNEFQLIATRARIRAGMVSAYLSMGIPLLEAWRLSLKWDGVLDAEGMPA